MIEVPPLKQDVGLTRPREEPHQEDDELPPLKIRRMCSPEKDVGPLLEKEVGSQHSIEKKQVEEEGDSKHSSSGKDEVSEKSNGEQEIHPKQTNGGDLKYSSPGKDSKHSSGKDSKHSSVGDSKHSSSGRDSKHSNGDSKHSSSGRDSKHSSDRDYKHSSGRDSKHSSDRDSKHSSGRDSKHSSDRDSKHSSGRDSKHSSSGRDSKHSSSDRDSKHSSERDSKHSSSEKIKVEKEGGSKHSSDKSEKSEKKRDGDSSSGRDSKHSLERDSKHHSDKHSKHSSDKHSKHSSDKHSKHSPDKHSKHSSEKHSKHSSDRDSKHSSDKHSKHSSDRDSKHTSSSRDYKHSSSGKESKHSSPGKESKHSSPGKESKHSSPGKESKHPSFEKDSKHSPGKDSNHSSGKDLVSEMRVEKEGDFKRPDGDRILKKSVENEGSQHSSVGGDRELVKIKIAKEEGSKHSSSVEDVKSEKKRVETKEGSIKSSSGGEMVSEKTNGGQWSEHPKPRCAASLPGDSGISRCTSSPMREYKPRCAASMPKKWKNKLDSDSEDDDDGVKKDDVDNDLERSDEDDSEEQDERPFFHKAPIKAYLPTDQIIGETPDNFPKDVEPMTFYPTYEEFKDLSKYVAYMESCGAVAAGIVKVVTPKEWVPRAKGYNPGDIDINLDHPVQQNISLADVDGAFKTLSDRSIPHFTPEEFVRLATSDKYITPSHNSYEELERLYWMQNLDDKLPAPIYGADVCDSVTDKDQKVFNIRRLESILTEVMEEQIPGVNLPYLYFGMWKATFSWHIEDMDLYAVNYLHFGAPKTWYCVPPQYGYKLEQVAHKLFPDMAKTCFNMMRHKAVMMSPSVLRANGVKVNKVIQEEGDLIIVFPHAYHSGFNHGYNIAESTNFAISRWVEYGKRFRDCVCRDSDDEVSINMSPFVKVVQPERHEDWRRNRDFALHPEDPWYIRRCLQDGVERLNREDITEYEFEKLKKELKRMRKVPNWFKERFVLDYDDQLEFLELPESGMDMTDCIDEGEVGIKASPRIKAAKRKLKERLEESAKICDIKMKKLRKNTTDAYMIKLKAYAEMQEELDRAKEEKKKLVLEGKGSNALGGGAARGVGFQGAVLDDLLEKKSRVVCKAKKNHRFKACAKCSGCRKTNCGECMYCLDMPRFGGMGVIKQKCETRVCVNPTITTCEHCVWTI